MTINATPTSTNAFNILAGPSTPGMLERARTTNPQPLSGDVLRAYDSYRDGLAAAAGVAVSDSAHYRHESNVT